jgi:hypothetical protein
MIGEHARPSLGAMPLSKTRAVPLTATLCAALLILGGSPARAADAGQCYPDAVGDAGDAPDIAQVTIRPVAAGLTIDVRLAEPTELGPYGWILVGLDTDRDPFTGGGRGDELLALTNGYGTTLTRWLHGRFTPNFLHQPFAASLSSTDLTFTIARGDLHARSFDFSVATLREQADLGPGGGIATYPGRPSDRCTAP